MIRQAITSLTFAVLLAVLGGCGDTTPPLSQPPIPGNSRLDLAVLLGGVVAPSRTDADRVLAVVDSILQEKSGVRIQIVGAETTGPGDPQAQAEGYVASHADSPPEAVVVFSDHASVTTNGGVAATVPLPPGRRNEFESSVVGPFVAYVAAVHYQHRHARCGYDEQGNRIAARSVNGECSNRTGLECVNNGEFWACPDVSGDLYANRDYFRACTVVHELLHPFGSAGNLDHYGTAVCRARTKMTSAQAADRRLAEESCAMCPDLFSRLKPGG